MSEFIYQSHYRPGTKIGKPDGMSRCSVEEKSGTEAKFFHEGQLIVLVEDKNKNEGEVKDVKLEGIDIAG